MNSFAATKLKLCPLELWLLNKNKRHINVYTTFSNSTLWASVKTDTTTIKLSENYRNIRTTYKLNSGLFSDTTAQRFVFYFFCRPAFFKNNFSQPHKWHIWFCPTHKPTLRKTKRAIFCQRTDKKPYFDKLFYDE